MAVRYKIDVLSALKESGYNTNRLRKEKLLSESTIQKFRKGEIVTAPVLAVICRLLNCQPGDLLEYVEE